MDNMWTWSITSTAMAALAAPLVLRECTVQIPGLPPVIISEDDDRPTPKTVERCEPPSYKKFGCRWELWCEDGSPVYARCPQTGERRFIREPQDASPSILDHNIDGEFHWQCPGPMDLHEPTTQRMARLGVRPTDASPLGWSLVSDVEGWMRGEIMAPCPGAIDQLWAMPPPESMCVSGQELTLDDGRTVVHTVLEGPPEACQSWVEAWNLAWHASTSATPTAPPAHP